MPLLLLLALILEALLVAILDIVLALVPPLVHTMVSPILMSVEWLPLSTQSMSLIVLRLHRHLHECVAQLRCVISSDSDLTFLSTIISFFCLTRLFWNLWLINMTRTNSLFFIYTIWIWFCANEILTIFSPVSHSDPNSVRFLSFEGEINTCFCWTHVLSERFEWKWRLSSDANIS